jgi:hypothetical protein
VSASVVVEQEMTATPIVVWSMISDITRMGEWSPEALGGVWLDGATGPAVGARFRGRNQNGWRKWGAKCRVTDATPGQRFAFEVTYGPYHVASWAYDIAALPSGGTRVTETWHDRRGIVPRFVGVGITGVRDRVEANRAGMVITLQRLAAAASTDA